MDADYASLRKTIAEQNKYAKDLESREVHLNNEYIGLLEKQSSGTQERTSVKGLDEKVRAMEKQLHELEKEKRDLND